jgi:hypothetical protein
VPRRTPAWLTGAVPAAVVAFGLAACGAGGSTTVFVETSGGTGETSPTGVQGGPGRAPGPVATVRHYYELVNDRNYARAWRFAPQSVRASVGSYDEFVAGYGHTYRSHAELALVSFHGGQAVVSVDLKGIADDVCAGDLAQQFRGNWTLQRVDGEWRLESADIRKVSGRGLITRREDCPGQATDTETGNRGPEGPTPTPPSRCTPGYSPCLPPASDYDCSSGTGDGPEYTDQVEVADPSDPYDLDRDGDGIGCDY